VDGHTRHTLPPLPGAKKVQLTEAARRAPPYSASLSAYDIPTPTMDRLPDDVLARIAALLGTRHRSTL
jgi:hypothetical protein